MRIHGSECAFPPPQTSGPSIRRARHCICYAYLQRIFAMIFCQIRIAVLFCTLLRDRNRPGRAVGMRHRDRTGSVGALVLRHHDLEDAVTFAFGNVGLDPAGTGGDLPARVGLEAEDIAVGCPGFDRTPGILAQKRDPLILRSPRRAEQGGQQPAQYAAERQRAQGKQIYIKNCLYELAPDVPLREDEVDPERWIVRARQAHHNSPPYEQPQVVSLGDMIGDIAISAANGCRII